MKRLLLPVAVTVLVASACTDWRAYGCDAGLSEYCPDAGTGGGVSGGSGGGTGGGVSGGTGGGVSGGTGGGVSGGSGGGVSGGSGGGVSGGSGGGGFSGGSGGGFSGGSGGGSGGGGTGGTDGGAAWLLPWGGLCPAPVVPPETPPDSGCILYSFDGAMPGLGSLFFVNGTLPGVTTQDFSCPGGVHLHVPGGTNHDFWWGTGPDALDALRLMADAGTDGHYRVTAHFRANFSTTEQFAGIVAEDSAHDTILSTAYDINRLVRAFFFRPGDAVPWGDQSLAISQALEHELTLERSAFTAGSPVAYRFFAANTGWLTGVTGWSDAGSGERWGFVVGNSQSTSSNAPDTDVLLDYIVVCP